MEKIRKGRVKITNKLIADALKFPEDWIIEDIYSGRFYDEIEGRISEMIIAGDDFPEMTEKGIIKEVQIIYHKLFGRPVIETMTPHIKEIKDEP